MSEKKSVTFNEIYSALKDQFDELLPLDDMAAVPTTMMVRKPWWQFWMFWKPWEQEVPTYIMENVWTIGGDDERTRQDT